MMQVKDGIMLNKINLIKGNMYVKAINLDDWETREGIYNGPHDYTISNEKWEKVNVGSYWEGRDNVTKWFKRTITIPEDYDGEKVVLDIEVGGEGLVYIDGKIKSAITSYIMPNDATRTRVLISESAKGGTTFEILIEAGLNYMEFARYRARGQKSVNYQFRNAKLAVVDTKVESYYFDALVTYEAMQVIGGNILDPSWMSYISIPQDIKQMLLKLNGDSTIYAKVLDALQSSLAVVDVDLSRDALVNSLYKAHKILWDKLEAISYTPQATISFTGHSHIDTAWLWPIKETIRKCSRTFANTIALLDEYPEHNFAQSQPQLYEYTKKYYPELYSMIKEKVAEGSWELVGNSWVECDTNIPSGESLVRQILYGRNFFKEEFGKWSKILWMPDVFGYSWALPQIIKRSGMEYFMTAKLNNNDVNRFPYTLFWWQGIDGTMVLSYLQRVSYNGNINPSYMINAWNRFDEKECLSEAMVTYGYGDGGGGPTYEMLEFSKRLKSFPGLPKAELKSAGSFFDDAAQNADKLPVWNNEMYYEFHRGTYTSQAHNKRNNRKSELLYRQAEMAASVASNLIGNEYPIDRLTEGWKLILLNQFHDIIPGSSINEVYKDCARDYEKVFDIGVNVQSKALNAIARNIKSDDFGYSIAVFNFVSWDRTGIVNIKVPGNNTNVCIMDSEGREYPCTADCDENGNTNISFEALNVPSMGYAVYSVVQKKCNKKYDEIYVTPKYMENRYFKISINEEGNITGIYDKAAGREVLTKGGYGNVLKIFEDKPERESAWNIDIEYQNKWWNVNDVKSIDVIESSSVKGVLRIVKKFNKSEITQDIIIYASTPRIDFHTKVDWQETEKLLKAAFDVDILSPQATYEIAFGAIKRPTHWNTSWDRARFEVPAHKWADLSEGGYGVSILNDCKYGYDIKDNVMRITLLKAPVYPDPVADKGCHEFVYSLYPHSGSWIDGNVVHAGYELNVPLTSVALRENSNGSLPTNMSFIEIDSSNVIVDTLKSAEDGEGFILRVYESCGCRGNVMIKMFLDVSEAFECNLMEENEKKLDINNGEINFYIKPYEIKTFRLIR